ncbi:MAG: rRNA pseudouridine synthase, partial [Balneolaceae bacterium]
NDGDLTHRMMHPSYRVKKVYEAVTSRPMTDEEQQTLAVGIELEDGPARPHLVRRSGVDPAVLEITVLEGRNHLVRRMIAHFGAEVTKLKRVRYAGLNLKGVSVGRWRYLSGKEVNNLRRSVKLDPLNFNKQTA